MSAMSASSGLLPLSLISEHKAAQGGPPPVPQLAFAPEKHPLVQAPASPKPTPNGMESSSSVFPVMTFPQSEPQPSLPCGGVSDVNKEEEATSSSSVPEVQVVEPSPSVTPAVPEQPAAEPTDPPPTVAQTASKNSLPSPQSVDQAVTNEVSSLQPSEPQKTVSIAQVESVDKNLPQPEIPQAPPQEPTEKLAKDESISLEQIQSDTENSLKPLTQAETVETQKSQITEQTPVQPLPQDVQQTSTEQPLPPQQSTTIKSVGRSKRTKSTTSGSEKKTAPAPIAAPSVDSTETENDDKRTKRKRLPTQVYQSPIPELTIIAKISKIDKAPTTDDKLIVFYRNEFLAVRNAEGGFYVCQAMQNVYKSSSKIRIRWLSQVANSDNYSPDFYDYTEFDCILTNLNLERVDKNKYKLPEVESQRTQSILKRAIDVEKGIAPPEESAVTEEHPDGLDLSLYRNEDQLKKRKRGAKNKGSKRKLKKTLQTEIVKKNRDNVRRNKTPVVENKKPNIVISQPKRVGRTGKVEKPVVQRIVAAKKMGRRKLVPTTSNKTNTTPPAVKEVVKKKESRVTAVKRKSNEAPSAPVPEKKVKTGASKTRNH